MGNNSLTVKNFEPIEKRFTQILDIETFKKECSFAMQHFKKNSYLNGATTESKLEAVLNVAQVGLTLNPVLKMAYLVPRFVDGQVKCFLEPSYQGLAKLVTDTGSAKSIYAHIVYKGDEFKTSLGTSVEIMHEPKFETTEVTHVYAVAILNDGLVQVDVMTTEAIDIIRDSSESYKAFKKGKTNSCIWDGHFGEMAKKTVVKRLIKYLPKTDMWDKLGTAIDLDNSDYKASYEQLDYIDSLIVTAAITPERMREIEQYKNTMGSEEAKEVIQELKDNQTDPIESGRNYSQTEIKNKLNQ